MKPISPIHSDIHLPPGGTCIHTSSSCVTWNGPDIPCIKLCNGDKIDTVVYQLATKLCDVTENVLDVTTLDFECLVENGVCPPETLLETLQLMITKICNPEPINPCDPTSDLPDVQLPPCLYYTNSTGDQVTSLPLDEYAQYLANVICQIIADINSIKATLVSLNNRVTILELSGSGGSGGTPVSTVIPVCTAGGSLTPISLPTAINNIENTLCQYISTLGSLPDWTDLRNAVCITDTTPLPCGTGTYGSLPGWIPAASVNSVADTLKNLWAAVCKLNECITATPPPSACATIPPTNVTITGVTNLQCTINWTAPTTIGLEAPSGYKIQVFNMAGTTSVFGPATVAATPTTFNVSSGSIVADTEYMVKVSAIYSCGTSDPATKSGILKTPTYTSKAYYTNTQLSTTPSICTPSSGSPVAYSEVTNQIKVELKDTTPSTNLVLNNTGQDIKLVVRIKTVGCGGAITFANQNVIIPSGASSGTLNYIAQEKTLCTGVCTDFVRTVECYVSLTLNDGSPLPSSIGIDTSLTTLGIC